jgi:hypothetical protein
VNTLAVDAARRIYVGGRFYLVNGQPRAHLARLLPDGSLDTAYAPDLALADESAEIRSLAPAPDGRCVLGGTFQTVQGRPLPGLARLRPDGSLDPAFQPAVRLRPNLPDAGVSWVEVLPDHRVVAGGTLATADGQAALDLVLLDERGQLLFALQGEGRAATTATVPLGTLVPGDPPALIAAGLFTPPPAGSAGSLARYTLAPARPEFRLYISREADQVVLDWLDAGRLEASPGPQGPWAEVPGAAAPYRVSAESGAEFYRLVR